MEDEKLRRALNNAYNEEERKLTPMQNLLVILMLMGLMVVIICIAILILKTL